MKFYNVVSKVVIGFTLIIGMVVIAFLVFKYMFN